MWQIHNCTFIYSSTLNGEGFKCGTNKLWGIEKHPGRNARSGGKIGSGVNIIDSHSVNLLLFFKTFPYSLLNSLIGKSIGKIHSCIIYFDKFSFFLEKPLLRIAEINKRLPSCL